MIPDILEEIWEERKTHISRWHIDATHSPADWWTIVSLNFAKALQSWKTNQEDPTFYGRFALRQGLVKVAAIIVAWIEAIDFETRSGS